MYVLKLIVVLTVIVFCLWIFMDFVIPTILEKPTFTIFKKSNKTDKKESKNQKNQKN